MDGRVILKTVSVLVAATLVFGCMTSEPEAPALESLSGMRDAADAAERTWGVPADLTLAVAYGETRWRVPEEESFEGEGEGHAPRAVGVGGLRPWLVDDQVATAVRITGLSRDVIATDATAGVLATAAVLRDLAVRRYGDDLPPAEEPGQWVDVVGDYSGLEGPEAQYGYARDVMSWLENGIATIGADGQLVTVAPRTVALPDSVGGRQAYAGSDYSGARWVAANSSNYTSGRGGNSIRYIVIHTMQGSYSGSISWFQNGAANVSAHYCVRSSDGQITQMVHDRDTAWHAGNWTYNQRSIGIEHEGYVSDPGRWYTEEMYRASAALTRHIADRYGVPIDRSHIIGHVEVPGATHTDPGSGWDWPHYMALVRGEPERPNFDAEYVDMDVPAEMTSGERAVAWVEMRNTGSHTWSLSNTWLGTTMPRDHASPFFDVENWENDHRATAPDHSDYGTGATGRFTFMITAPEVTEDTVITDTFGLVQEGVTWFGPRDVTLSVTVHPAAPPPPPATDPDAGTDLPPPPPTEDSSTPPPTPDATPVVPTDPAAGSGGISGGCAATGSPLPASWAWLAAILSLGVVRRRRR